MLALNLSVPALPQSRSGDRPHFEVASVKPCASSTITGTNSGTTGLGKVAFNCQPLWDYVRFSYTRQVGFTQIEGGPPWVHNDLFQITAKGDGSHTKNSDTVEMMRALLEDRFKLKVHKETRTVPVYALVATRAGIRLPAAKVECWTENPDQLAPRPKPGEAPVPWCGMGRRTRDRIEVHGATMADFCLSLSNMPFRLDRRKFIDKTGIGGHFDFDLKISGAPGIPMEPGAAPVPMDDFTLLQDALGRVGLKLETAKGPDEVLVIDHAERPTPN